MTYEKSVAYFWMFDGIETAHHANSYLSIRGRTRETLQALIYYMSNKGVVMTEGKFYQWWEYNESTGEVKPVQVKTDGFVGERSIIKKPGCQYAKVWDRKQAVKHFKTISTEINHE